MISADSIIEHFDLEPHPEGGFYKRTFLANDNAFSSIVFLLTKGNFSAFHQLNSDEQWNWYLGDTIIIHEIFPDGTYKKTELGKQVLNFQYIVQAGNWFASECVENHGFAFCGCTVIPAFSFDNFILADRKNLTTQFPEHQEIIERFTR
ncbi:MAG: cupin domain-containing protein [Bacteroidetes bacterium]|nr:cupin domain-containing protein [Bacteroidota bacterium]